MPFALYLLNLGVSKLPATIVATSFLYSMHWLCFVHIGCHEDAFAICMELGVLQTIDVALRAGNGIHRPTIVDELQFT